MGRGKYLLPAGRLVSPALQRRLLAGVEVLVKPVSRRAIDTSLAPFNLDHFILVAVIIGVNAPLLGPEQNITDGLKANDNGAGPVIVSLVIFSNGPLAQVTHKSVTRHLKLAQTEPGAFHLEIFQERVFYVGNKIGFPNVDQAADVSFIADVKVVLFTMEAIRETVRTIENEILISIDIKG